MRFGVVGKRGLSQVLGIRSVAGAEVTHFADPNPTARAEAEQLGIPSTTLTFEELIQEVDAVVIGTPMSMHARQSISALDTGVHVCSEVVAATTIEDLLALQQSAKKSAATYTFAENYNYFRENLIVTELVKTGAFGELYFGEGEYIHEVRFLHRNPDGTPTWRMAEQVGVPGNTYITHEIGPLMQWLKAADPGISIESVACFGTGVHTDRELNHDDSSTTLIKLSNGGLLNLRLDMVSNRPGRTKYSLQGTTGCYESSDGRHLVWIGENKTVGWNDSHRQWKPIDEFAHLLPAALVAELEMGAKTGHGGADFFVGRRFAQSVVEGREVEFGIDEAVAWTGAGLLSQKSIAEGSRVIPFSSLTPKVETQLQMIRHDLEGLASGGEVEIRLASREDAGAIATALSAAFPEMSWTHERVCSELIDAQHVWATYVAVADGQIIGTASCADHSSDPSLGYVHWVGVDPAYRGKQVGFWLTAQTLHAFRVKGLKGAVLNTDAFRIPAIKTYLRLGFVPDYPTADHEVRWAALELA